jgi:antitoxin HicB
MPYNFFDYHLKIYFDSGDKEYVAFIEEIPEVSTFGDTIEKAIQELKSVYEGWLEICQSDGYPVPEPIKLEDYSGKFVVRVPKSLHKRLTERAKADKVSLNQEVIYSLTKGLLAA